MAEAPHPLATEAGKRRALYTVAFALFLDLAGFGIILPVLPYFAEHHGASATAVTLLSTTFSLAQFMMSPVLGRLSDRRGRRPVMLISIAGSVAAGLVLGFASSLWVLFLARLVAGVSKANVSTAHAYVADLVPPKDRAKYMGMMGAAMGAGFVFGPGIGGLLSWESFPTLPFFVAAGLSAANWVMAYFWLPETRGLIPEEQRAEQKKSPGALKLIGALGKELRGTHMGWIVVITFAFYISFASMESTMALFNEAVFGWGAPETGGYMTFIGVVIVVFQGVLVGRSVSRFGESMTLVIGLVCIAVGMTLLGGLETYVPALGFEVEGGLFGASRVSLGTFALGGLLMAGGNGLVSANLSALVSLVSKPDEQGWHMGLKESASALARIMGPALAGPIFERVAHGAPLLFGGVVAFLTISAALHLRNRLRRDGLKV